MSTAPSIVFQGPSNLDGYSRKRRSSEQPASIPKTFLDAMQVREQVFVIEQGVPLENEFDSDDSRSCHWVVYASTNTFPSEETSTDIKNIMQAQKIDKPKPIGTIRLVPFPHSPHLEPCSSYAADALEAASDAESSDPPPYIVDRTTTYHDGTEPYIKLGRIAVLKEFRGSGIAKVLANAAMEWAQQNPTFFNPSTESVGLKLSNTGELPEWKGLMFVHAQEQVTKAWGKWGFRLDEGMGTWVEEGINHVGMFKRVDIARQEV